MAEAPNLITNQNDEASRIVPITALRRRYEALRAKTVAEQVSECDRLLSDIDPLVEEFVEAVARVQRYENDAEDFHGRPVGSLPPEGANPIVKVLARDGGASTNTGYWFRYLDYEIAPLRTTKSLKDDGGKADKSGAGGIDYLGVSDGDSQSFVLGEVKVGSDKDPFYALIQLLTYASELATSSQMRRLSRAYQVQADSQHLHIVLADFNDRSAKAQLIDQTRLLAEMFIQRLKKTHPDAPAPSAILCLDAGALGQSSSWKLLWRVDSMP